MVVGTSITTTRISTVTRPVRWVAQDLGNGVLVIEQDLGTLGGADGEARGVSAAGQIVGVAVDGQGRRRAFLWTPGGMAGPQSNPQMQDLGTLGGAESRAYRINNRGEVAGWAQAGDGSVQPFLWLPTAAYGLPAGMNPLDSAGYARGMAFGIDDLGNVVGALDVDGSVPPQAPGRDVPSAGSVGFRWDPNTRSSIVLPPLSVGSAVTPDAPTYATAVASTAIAGRTVVGTSGAVTKTGGAGPRAVTWDDADTIHDLNHDLDANPQGWLLTHVAGINRAGELSGDGRRDGGTWAWVADPHVHVTYSDLLNSLLTAWVVSVWGDSRFDGSTGRPSIGVAPPPPPPDPIGAATGHRLDNLLGALVLLRLADALDSRPLRHGLQAHAMAGLRLATTEATAATLAELHAG
jgi:probable HAF family extracellular repeat protein